jgi:G-patch domain
MAANNSGRIKFGYGTTLSLDPEANAYWDAKLLEQAARDKAEAEEQARLAEAKAAKEVEEAEARRAKKAAQEAKILEHQAKVGIKNAKVFTTAQYLMPVEDPESPFHHRYLTTLKEEEFRKKVAKIQRKQKKAAKRGNTNSKWSLTKKMDIGGIFNRARTNWNARYRFKVHTNLKDSYIGSELEAECYAEFKKLLHKHDKEPYKPAAARARPPPPPPTAGATAPVVVAQTADEAYAHRVALSRGRDMMEKMGWRSGRGLGADGNTGIKSALYVQRRGRGGVIKGGRR